MVKIEKFAKLNAQEVDLIKKVCEIELESLGEILENELDLLIEDNLCGFDPGSLKAVTEKALKQFEELRDNPESLPRLNPILMDIFLHIFHENRKEFCNKSAPKFHRKLNTFINFQPQINLN